MIPDEKPHGLRVECMQQELVTQEKNGLIIDDFEVKEPRGGRDS